MNPQKKVTNLDTKLSIDDKKKSVEIQEKRHFCFAAAPWIHLKCK